MNVCFSQVLKFRSPYKLKKQILIGRKCKSTLNEKKANMQHFWYEVVEECIVIEELKTHNNSKRETGGRNSQILQSTEKRIMEGELES